MGCVPTERNIADAIGLHTCGRDGFALLRSVTCQTVAREARSYRGWAWRCRPAGQGGTGSYLADISALVMSSMRLEKPHSLSYHDRTFTKVPSITRVCVES